MRLRKLLLAAFAALLSLSFGLSLADATRAGGEGAHSWRTAPRHSAGIAPDPEKSAATAIVQVYDA